MKPLTKLHLLAALFMLLLVSCYYDKEEQLYPDNVTTCDTSGTIS